MYTFMNTLIANTIAVIFGLGVTAFIIYGLGDALERQDIVDCNKHIRYSKELSNYYITTYENKLCETVGVKVDVRISDDNGLTFK